jgi:hypothetical protein
MRQVQRVSGGVLMPKKIEPADSTDLTIEELVNAHQKLIHSAAMDQDDFSLAQPSPLKYVPSIASDKTTIGPEDRWILQY